MFALASSALILGLCCAVVSNAGAVTFTGQACTSDFVGDLLTQVTASAAAAPVIVGQPVGLLSQIGASATFSVNATGTPSLTYQWKFNGSNILASANASAVTDTLLLPSLTSASFGNYSVAVSNGASTVVSAAAALQLDSVGDGIPDSWKTQYFGANWASNANSAANADADGDGLTNLQEYQDGTSPVSASSHFYTLTIEGGNAVNVAPAGTRFAPGTVVTLTAPPVAALQFAGWTGDIVTTANPLTLTMNQNYHLGTQYGALPLDNSVPSFTTTVGTEIDALAVQGNGQVIVAGNFQAEDGVAHYGLARLNADGSLDNTFGPAVTLGTEGVGAAIFQIPGYINAIAVQTNGQVLVAGDFNYINGGQSSPYITRINTDGSVDSTFHAAVPQYSTIQQLAVNSSGTVLVLASGALLELNAGGSLNTAFTSALPANSYIDHVVWQTDGKVVYNGSDAGGQDLFGRLNANGTLDSTYTPAVTPGAYDLLGLRANNEVYIASRGNLGTDPNNTICAALLTTTGAVDPSFTAPVNVSLGNPVSLAVLSAGGFVVNGGVTIPLGNNNYTNQGLAYFKANGTLNTTVFAGLDPYGNGFSNLAIDSTGALLIAGSFTKLGTVQALNMGRVSLSSGAVDTAYLPPFSSLSSVSGIATMPNGFSIVWGDFNVVNGYYRPYVARMGPPGYVDLGFNSGAGPNDQVRSAVIQPNGAVVMGGDFTQVNGGASHNVARFNSDGSLDTNFAIPGTGFNGYQPVQVLALQPDGKIVVGGGFTAINGVSHPYIARLNSDGSVDSSFNASANNTVQSIVLQPDGRILVGGIFTKMDGVAAGAIARLNANGTLDTSFYPADLSYLLSGTVETIALQPNGQILAGGIFNTGNQSINSVPGAALIRLNADGSPDSAFNNRVAGLLDLPGYVKIDAIAVQPDGGIVAAGLFSVNGYSNRGGVIRLNANADLDPAFFSIGTPDQEVDAVALPANGGMMFGGSFAHFDGQYRLAYARLATTNNIQMGTLGVTVGGSGVTFSLPAPAASYPIVAVIIEQSTDGGVTFQSLGNASANSDGSWSYQGAALPPGIVYYRATATDSQQEQASTYAAGPYAGPLNITSPTASAGYAGVPFSYVATASAIPTSFTAANLPAWASASFNSATGTLTISGTPSAEGSAAVTLTAKNAMTTAAATLRITIYNRFAAWQSANFTSAQLQNAAISGPLGDATGAGIVNLIKYALGVPAFQAANAKLPAAGMSTVGGQNYLTLTYTLDLLTPDVTATVEASGDLATWNSGQGYTSQVSATNNGNGTQTVVVRDDVPFSAHTQRYLRLRITQNASP
jgi:uncharacterized delta-60 repeat protein